MRTSRIVASLSLIVAMEEEGAVKAVAGTSCDLKGTLEALCACACEGA